MHIQIENLPSPMLLQGRQLQDRRHTPRVSVLMAAWIWLTDDPEEALVPMPIQVLDYSDRGVGFLSSLPLDIDALVDLDLEGEGLRRTRLRVTRCELHTGDLFRVGALCEGKPPN
jgi:hypothetical protein